MLHRLLFIVLFLSLIVFSVRCAESTRGSRQAPNALTELAVKPVENEKKSGIQVIGKVVKLKPLAQQERLDRKRWIVTLKVLRVIGAGGEVHPGDRVSILVHSPVKSFGLTGTDLLEKKYSIRFLEEFAKVYSGPMEVSGPLVGEGE